jgi:hypothetical protein
LAKPIDVKSVERRRDVSIVIFADHEKPAKSSSFSESL